MRKSAHIESILPTVLVPKVPHRPIKQIMLDLKERKNIIKRRIRTQLSDWQNEQKDDQPLSKEIIPAGISYSTNKKVEHSLLNFHSSFNDLKSTSLYKSQQINKITTNREGFKTQKLKQSSFVEFPTVLQRVASSPKKKKHGMIMPRELESILIDVPLDPKDRTPENIEFLRDYLTNNNIFMAKIHQKIVTCLLLLNRLIWVQKDETVFKAGTQNKAFYIIVLGKVRLYSKSKTGKRTCKICLPGETIGEEILFSNAHRKVNLEYAKSLTRTFLVEIKLDNYKKICQQLVLEGYKTQLNQMQNVIKRNYITKNWLRSEQSRLEH